MQGCFDEQKKRSCKNPQKRPQHKAALQPPTSSPRRRFFRLDVQGNLSLTSQKPFEIPYISTKREAEVLLKIV